MVDSKEEQLSRLGCLWVVIAVGGLALLAGLAALLLFTGDGDEPAAATGTPTATPPGGTPSPASDPAPWTVELADRAGDLTLTFSGGAELPHREAALNAAGIGVRDLVGGSYEDPSANLVIDFNGGVLDPPQPGVDPRQLLETAFAASFPNLELTGEFQQYDAGPPGGEIWCHSYQSSSHACGWVDEWTIGIGFSVVGAEADTAARLADMRQDLQTPG